MNKELTIRHQKILGKELTQKNLEIKNKIANDTYVRVNFSKISIQKFEQFLKSNRIIFSKTFLPNAFKIEKSFFNLSSSIPALAGEIYIQDLASQIPVNCIDFQKLKSLNRTINILDMAASPGSKTTQLADILNYHKLPYVMIALEPEKKRLTKLINNIQKQGFENIKIINSTGQEFKSDKKFDLILLDAPCSGNLIGDRDWLNKRNKEGIFKMAKIQKELLENANNLLHKNGDLIYSTCSMEIEENEENVKWAQEKFNLKTSLPKLNIPFDTKPLVKGQYSLRFIPYISKTQGFFVCMFSK